MSDVDETLADYVRVAGSWGARRIAIPIHVAAAALDEIDQLRARVAELEEQVKEAVVRLARVPDMIDRERREGAEAMRERAVAALDRGVRLWPANSEGRGIAVAARETIRALPLDDDAREDAKGGE